MSIGGASDGENTGRPGSALADLHHGHKHPPPGLRQAVQVVYVLNAHLVARQQLVVRAKVLQQAALLQLPLYTVYDEMHWTKPGTNLAPRNLGLAVVAARRISANAVDVAVLNEPLGELLVGSREVHHGGKARRCTLDLQCAIV